MEIEEDIDDLDPQKLSVVWNPFDANPWELSESVTKEEILRCVTEGRLLGPTEPYEPDNRDLARPHIHRDPMLGSSRFHRPIPGRGPERTEVSMHWPMLIPPLVLILGVGSAIWEAYRSPPLKDHLR